MNPALSEPPSAPPPKPFPPVVPGMLLLFALWFVLCRHLSGEWSANEQYSYGWFVPFFALFLFWLRWSDRPEGGRGKAQGGGLKLIALVMGAVALLLLLPVRVFELANPDWRPLAWLHTATVVSLTFLLIWAAGGTPWLRHFAFPICFFFVAVPWVSAVEQPIVLGLMRMVAAVATEALTLFGVPAQLEGNLIRVSNGLVGVNEACSGVRSVQTSLMIGLLFGELHRLSVARRIALVLGALALAIIANFGRAFLLVWVAATQNISAVDRYHDVAGYAIVGVVFLGSLGLSVVLGRRREGRGLTTAGEHEIGGQRSEGRSPRDLPSFTLHPSVFILFFAWLIAVEAAAEAWYRGHERNLSPRRSWTVSPPEKSPGFREIKIDENVRQTLRFDTGREVMWKTSEPAMPGVSTTNYLFFFRWNPGSASVLRARAHRPDICLPSIGWQQVADHGTKTYLAHGDIPIVAQHISFRQTRGNTVAHTFFCLQEDKFNPRDPRPDLQYAGGVQPDWSMQARIRVVQNGIRNLGQQVLEVVLLSSPQLDSETAAEKFEQLIREVVVAEK